MVSFFKKHHKKFVVSIVCIVIAISSSVPVLAEGFEYNFTSVSILNRAYPVIDEVRSEPDYPYDINLCNTSNFWTSNESGEGATEVWYNSSFRDEPVKAINNKVGGEHTFVWANHLLFDSLFYSHDDYHFYVDYLDFYLDFTHFESAYKDRFSKNKDNYTFTSGQDYTITLDYFLHDCFGGGLPDVIDFGIWLVLSVPSEDNDLGIEYLFVPYTFAFYGGYPNAENLVNSERHTLNWDFRFNCDYNGHTQFSLSAVLFAYIDNQDHFYPDSSNQFKYQLCVFDFFISEKTIADPLSSTNEDITYVVDDLKSVNENMISGAMDSFGSLIDSFDANTLLSFSNAALAFTSVFDTFFNTYSDLSIVLTLALILGAFSVICGIVVSVGRSNSRNSSNSNKKGK